MERIAELSVGPTVKRDGAPTISVGCQLQAMDQLGFVWRDFCG
jgi:hypothetical protein